MNGNGQEPGDRKINDLGCKGRGLSPLSPDAVEGAITEKLQCGHTEEKRFGFAAIVANATPPVNETFRRRLRASIVAEGAQSIKEARQMRTIPDRAKEMTTRRLYPRLRLAFTLSMAAALLAFVFATPWGRALAQNALRFFVQTESTTFPLQPSQIVTSVPDPSAPADKPSAPIISIAEAEGQVGFDVAELPFVPDGFNYLGARVYDSTASIEYEAQGGGGSLIIRQSTEGFVQSDWDEVPEDAVIPVNIGELDGEFAQGTFVVYAGETTATWNPDASILRMRWVKDGIWFQMTKSGDVEAIEYLDQTHLIELAESLTVKP